MCGINGFNFNDEKLVLSMNEVIKHRGPDDRGIFKFSNLTFGHVRLSIVDLSNAGHQPMFYNKKLGASNDKFNLKNILNSNISITYNGEIYNYIEIKKELEKIGYVFSTKTDTEIILASYLEWGEECVNKFNGMWAFVIYDIKKKILFCSRDRLGVKPFYYYFKNEEFIFSSELKGILEHKKLNINKKININSDGVDFYFSLGFIPAPYTIFNNVFKLEASKNLIFDLKNNKIIYIKKYYEIPNFNPKKNKKKLIEEGKKLFSDAVKLRMKSDVPVGAFLSGGLDSSSVVGMMKNYTNLKKLHTFSIGFEGKYDETKYINIAKNKYHSNHHHYYFKEKDFLNLINKYSKIYDEPFSDYSGYPTYKVSELAKKNVKVSLSGDGGDEIFSGYNFHLIGARLDFLKKIPKFIRVLGSKFPVKKKLNSFYSFYLFREAFKLSLENPKKFFSKAIASDKYVPEIYKKWTEEKLLYSLKKGNYNLSESFRIYDLLFNTLSDNFLVKVDRASMINGLEVRSPFLDYRFIEFSQKIPSKWKIDIFKTKKIMREIIKKFVPKEITYRGKGSFTPPIEKWILDKKYNKKLSNSLEIVKDLNKEIFEFYSYKVFSENNKLYINYKIRLFIFGEWYKKWIK